MSFTVEILDEVGYRGLNPDRVTELCAAAFTRCGLDVSRMGEVSVVLVDAKSIRNLNREFRDIDAPTDVLSFEIDGPHGEMVGEIVVAPEYAGPEMDVEELVVHGALHLAGMDHGEDFEASEMARVQEAVMDGLRG